MIAWIAAQLIALNPSLSIAAARRFAKTGVIGVSLLVLVGGFALWLKLHDRALVEEHETGRRLEQAQIAIESERRATTNSGAREAARHAAAAQSAEAMKDAEDADPEAARAPAGAVSRAAARRFQVRD